MYKCGLTGKVRRLEGEWNNPSLPYGQGKKPQTVPYHFNNRNWIDNSKHIMQFKKSYHLQMYIRCVYQRQNELHNLYEYICTFISNFSSLCMAQQCRDDKKSKIFKLRSSMFIQTSKTTYVRHVQCVMNKLRYLLTTILNVSFDF